MAFTIDTFKYDHYALEYYNLVFRTTSAILKWSTSERISKLVCSYSYNDSSTILEKTFNFSSPKTEGSFNLDISLDNVSFKNVKIVVTHAETGETLASEYISFVTPKAKALCSLTLKEVTINTIKLRLIVGCDTDQYEYTISDGANSYTATVNALGSPSDENYIIFSKTNCDKLEIVPGTTYTITCRVRHAEYEEWGWECDPVTVTTLAIPSLSITNSSSSFDIGDAIELNVNNYKNITSTIIFQAYVDSSWETIGDSYNGNSSILTIAPDASTLYAKIPNSNTLKTRFVCSCSNDSRNYSSYLNLDAKVTDANPTLSTFSVVTNYKTLTDVPSILGDRKLLLGQGDVYVNIPAGSAVAQKGASLVECKVYKQKSEGGGLYELVASKKIDPIEKNERIEIEVPLSNFNKTGLYNLFVRFYDSRGNKVDSSKNNYADTGYAVTVLPYHTPYITPSVIRTDGFGKTLDIDLTVQIASVMQDDAMKNTIKSIKLISTKISDNTSQSFTLSPSDYTAVDIGNENEYRVRYFAQPSSVFTVNEDDVYDFCIEVTDNFTDTYSTSLTITKAKSLLSMYSDGFVTVNKKEPDFDSTAPFQIGGDVMFQSKGEDVLLSECLSNLDTQITNEISTLKESVTTNTGKISTNTKNIATNKSNISKNTTNIANLQTDVNDIKTKFIDYIIEENVDASTGHRYRIWKSGMKECWFGFKVSTAINTTWGNGYRSGALSSEAYPVPFNGSPIVLMNVKGSTADSTDAAQLMMYNSGTQYKPPSFYLVRPAALTTSTTFSIQGYAFGV